MGISKLRINLPNAPFYDVRVGSGAIERLASSVRELVNPGKTVMIADEAVKASAGAKVHSVLAQGGFPTADIAVPSGEGSKSLEMAGQLFEALSDMRVGRDGLIVAVGGGVVGDLAAFVASTYLRGIPCVQVPTTLLSMVDSSVGGKTAVNLPQGKNLVGTFTQPLHVVADTDFLKTLPDREWQCGLGEVAKTAMIGPASFYSWMQREIEGLSAHDKDAVEQAICQCIAYKGDVVVRDEHETGGLREQLNYGHTLAHAIEKVAGYGKYSHGYAVAEGMRFAARIAEDVLGADAALAEEQDAMLDLLGLPPFEEAFDPKALLDAMHSDKKARSGRLRFMLLKGQGDVSSELVDDALVLRHLEQWAAGKA